MRSSVSSFLALVAVVPTLVVGQLNGTVGPLTSISDKTATKTCDITDYGATADGTTDISDAITSAFAECKTGGVVVIPDGNYALENWVTLSGGSAWALQLDGIITRTGTDGGNMIMIEHSDDFELFSSTSSGAIQGLGYEFHKDDDTSGPRLLRLYEVTDFSIHDILLVDSPVFHLSLDTCQNGEVYNMAIRGGNEGGLDGVDVWSTNIWVHDVMVTNKDECVTIKSPASNILVENVYCNWSGGCSIGSLGADTDITNVTYRNVYTWSSNNMLLIKSNGGSGSFSNAVFENFIGHGNAYSLDIDQYWSSMSTVAGDGVQLSNIKINNWTGTEVSGAERGPIKVACADGAPCYDIEITDFAMWTESGDYQGYSCESAYGSGFCLEEGSDYVAYDLTTTTVTAAPTGYSAATMAEDLTTDFGTTASIPIPTLPASFFPGIAPYSAFASSGSSTSAAADKVAAVSSSSAVVAASSSAAVASQTPVASSSAVVASQVPVASSSAAISAVSSAVVAVSTPATTPATTLLTSVASISKTRSVSSYAIISSSAEVPFDTSSSLLIFPISSAIPLSTSAPASASTQGSGNEIGAVSGEDDDNCEVVYVEA